MLLAGPIHAAALLLVVAGGQKAVDPRPLVRALRTLGARLPAAAVRLVALAEVGIGGYVLVVGDRLSSSLLATSYAAFTAFVLVALARGGVLASCGCFGKHDVPPTRTHAAITGGLALAAASGAPGSVHGDAALLAATAAVAACAYLALAVLPLLKVAR